MRSQDTAQYTSALLQAQTKIAELTQEKTVAEARVDQLESKLMALERRLSEIATGAAPQATVRNATGHSKLVRGLGRRHGKCDFVEAVGDCSDVHAGGQGGRASYAPNVANTSSLCWRKPHTEAFAFRC